MVTEIDHQAIKTRIKDIIEADEDLFDKKGEDGKLVEVFVGRPFSNSLSAHSTPFCFITNDDLMEQDRATGSIESNAATISNHIIRYQVVLVDDGTDGQDAEKLLDNLQKKLKERLKSNITLVKPSDSSDPLVHFSWPEQTTQFFSGESGEVLQGRNTRVRIEVNSS